MKETRKCIICGEEFEKPVTCCKNDWEQWRKTCSKKCWYKYRSKIVTPWNKWLTKENNTKLKEMADRFKWKNFATPKKGSESPNYGKKHKIETRIKMSKSHSLEKHRNWQGWITDETHRLRNKMKYQDWRKKVLKRDNNVCQICWIENIRMDCHHIKDFKENESLRYDIANGITLCQSCHTTEHHRLKNKI